jgi:hypothetical protein
MRVSPALFQAQGLLGVVRWNYKRAIENRNLSPPVFDPKLTVQLNQAHRAEYGVTKYPDLSFNLNETEELFGVECLAWDAVSDEIKSSVSDKDTHVPAISVEVCCGETGETAVFDDFFAIDNFGC